MSIAPAPEAFGAWFRELHGFTPHGWQEELGVAPDCADRLIRIPTGFGKTAGIVSAWLFHRVVRDDDNWPRRLVITLPMRVLVEQTLEEVRTWVARLGLDVGVHPVMGGLVDKEFALSPDRPAVLIGTQDMLLSRAMNRGYAAARGRWPVDFGLLHHDALWVLDEVQLMDVGLATTAQLAAFRAHASAQMVRPAVTWWMSATLQPDWLRTVDWAPEVDELAAAALTIPASERQGPLWEVHKPLERAPAADAKSMAELILSRHESASLTLVVLNRVDRATELWSELQKRLKKTADAPDLRLVHSRFRPRERQGWKTAFLDKKAAMPSAGRIVVSTQVVEAGVDISARLLVTDLAPWPSLVQRFGRAARYEGETAQIVIVGDAEGWRSKPEPYAIAEIEAADRAVGQLQERGDGSPRAIEAFVDTLTDEQVRELFPYRPAHVLRRVDLDDLFDTSPDLSGSDLDVSRYIRSGPTRDVQVLWRDVQETGARSWSRRDQPLPQREELCSVPVGLARKWLEKVGTCWRYDYVEGEWVRADARRLAPGQLLLVPSSSGGYDLDAGFTGKGSRRVAEARDPSPRDDAFETAAADPEDESLSISGYKTIATHGYEVAQEAAGLAARLALPADLSRILELAGRWHDAGKAHPVFQDALKPEVVTGHLGDPPRRDLAKAPDDAWKPRPYPRGRSGFRHELVSALGLLALLRRTRPDHPALRGGVRASLDALGYTLDDPEDPVAPDHPLAAEVAELDADAFDLLLWLVVTHHGKVRGSWASTPRDLAHDQQRPPIHGVRDGDLLPTVTLTDAAGVEHALPDLDLDLAPARMGLHPAFGPSWADRVARLLRLHGPFRLAFLEAVLRAADVRASRLSSKDPLL